MELASKINYPIGYGSSVARLRMSRDEIDEYTEQMYHAMKNTLE